MPPLNERLRHLREAAGLAQPEAARRIGVHKVQLSKWERGVNVPGTDKLARIAAAYGVPTTSLVSEDAAGEAETLGRVAPPATNGPDVGATLPISRDLAFYWRGQLDIVHKLLVTLDTSVLTLRDQLAAVTDGVGGFMASGILPDRSSAQWQPVPPVSAEARAQAAEEDARALQALREREAAARATPPAGRRRAGGGR